MYIRPDPSTATSPGRGPLEVECNKISRILGVGEFAWNVASNAWPSIGLDLGIATTDALERRVRAQLWSAAFRADASTFEIGDLGVGRIAPDFDQSLVSARIVETIGDQPIR